MSFQVFVVLDGGNKFSIMTKDKKKMRKTKQTRTPNKPQISKQPAPPAKGRKKESRGMGLHVWRMVLCRSVQSFCRVGRRTWNGNWLIPHQNTVLLHTKAPKRAILRLNTNPGTPPGGQKASYLQGGGMHQGPNPSVAPADPCDP